MGIYFSPERGEVDQYMAIWGKEHGYKLIYCGGGTSNDPEDNLLQFKLKFTRDTIFNFYIAKVVKVQEVYDESSYMKGVAPSMDGYFPRYRRGYGEINCVHISSRRFSKRCVL